MFLTFCLLKYGIFCLEIGSIIFKNENLIQLWHSESNLKSDVRAHSHRWKRKWKFLWCLLFFLWYFFSCSLIFSAFAFAFTRCESVLTVECIYSINFIRDICEYQSLYWYPCVQMGILIKNMVKLKNINLNNYYLIYILKVFV